MCGRVIELMAIIALNPLGSGAKLCSNVGEKVGQRGKGVSLQVQWKGPKQM
jgi:hypothetical protein